MHCRNINSTHKQREIVSKHTVEYPCCLLSSDHLWSQFDLFEHELPINSLRLLLVSDNAHQSFDTQRITAQVASHSRELRAVFCCEAVVVGCQRRMESGTVERGHYRESRWAADKIRRESTGRLGRVVLSSQQKIVYS